MSQKRSPASLKSQPRGVTGERTLGASLTLAERIHGVLATKNLTLYEVAALTRTRFPRDPRHHIPSNFYFQLRSAGLSPNLPQLVALSGLSGYRLADWLAVFGFCLDEIPRLQAALHHPRTTLLDSNVYDSGATISWFRDRSQAGAISPVAPLSQLLEPSGSSRLSSLLATNHGDFLYVKIGQQDAFAFPDLIPGSIVRANPRLAEGLAPRSAGEISKAIFLVEHSCGFSCCRLYRATIDHVTLTATQLPFANVELKLGSQARILGVLDLEFRPLTNRQSAVPLCALPEVAHNLAKLWAPAPLDVRFRTQRPAIFLRKARLRAGLSLRHASEMSRAVARALGDQRYFTSPGSLSDYEASGNVPRHIHKLFTVCVLYSVAFGELLNSFELGLEQGTMASIPDEWMPQRDWQTPQSQKTTASEGIRASGFLAAVLDRFGELPLFLRNSLSSMSGLPEISLRDVFWVGGQEKAMHPSLTGALFVIVNHRRKRPRAFCRKPAWEQPLYLLMRRDGSYALASCGLEDGAIVVHPYTESFVRPERFRNRVDAEVVGQIVAIVRSLPPPP
jgi:transcriptional regulator with XRE-family HTH domain